MTGRPVRVPEVKVRALLANLLAHHGQVVPTVRLIEALWGGTPPANPTASLQAKVSQLRRALEDAEEGARDLVVHRAPGYTLQAPQDAVDSCASGPWWPGRHTGRPAGRAAALEDALALWRGPAFADFADEPFVHTALAQLEEERLTAVEEHFETRLELGEHSLLIGELAALVTAHPLRERLRMAHMRALHQAARSSEALASYADLRRHLDTELGLVPSEAADALQQAILRQDPELRGPAAPATAEAAPRPAPACRTSRTRWWDGTTRWRKGGAWSPGAGSSPSPVPGRRQDQARGRRGRPGRRRLSDGVRLVEFAGLRPADQDGRPWCLAQHVLAALGIREGADQTGARPGEGCGPEHHLLDFVASRRLLLVLDNCEHVLDDVALLVRQLLEQAPGVTVLATSREPVRLQGETVWPVPPLELPRSTERVALERSSAVRLFVERARSADPPSSWTRRPRPPSPPCAAAWTASRWHWNWPPHGYGRSACTSCSTGSTTASACSTPATGAPRTASRRCRRRSSGAGVCSGPRNRPCCGGCRCTSRAARWPPPRSVRRRRGGRRRRRRHPVAAGGPVAGDPRRQPRRRPLPAAGVGGAYARARLAEAGEAAQVTRRHTVHYTELAERARPHLHGPEQQRWLRRLSAETANFRQAVREAADGGSPELALRLVNALAWFWILMGRLTEAGAAWPPPWRRPARCPARQGFSRRPPGARGSGCCSARSSRTSSAGRPGSGPRRNGPRGSPAPSGSWGRRCGTWARWPRPRAGSTRRWWTSGRCATPGVWPPR
ncbi:BTAD domain-containing putative transcriptional regulator [Streptomyces diastatochromogenes]|nr:BTAD domain-containing putative transcriptional regulator [Streptomyces diastatochromogenes]